ncbi:hypothetical protein DOTSEDRAFT_72152 [Dothistroma septosporum NZE10]|uniref:Uncharacterized protein n=1 Tax=Dothistroma septosporum (strain NZE10 / CBS 128990) TaxID=675120 RepID=N1PQF3_DOTSN|nr:hypothetical protein DOTSEDRAFT_72152 [Dothistroma septosporum NZE10]
MLEGNLGSFWLIVLALLFLFEFVPWYFQLVIINLPSFYLLMIRRLLLRRLPLNHHLYLSLHLQLPPKLSIPLPPTRITYPLPTSDPCHTSDDEPPHSPNTHTSISHAAPHHTSYSSTSPTNTILTSGQRYCHNQSNRRQGVGGWI